MKNPATIVLAIVGLFVCALISTTPSRAQNPPVGRYGSWSSTMHPGAGGQIQLADLRVSNDGGMVGRIFFSGSVCGVWADFIGHAEGNSVTMSMTVGACGITQVAMQWQGAAWVGTYTSLYPDAGVVQMVP
jgi:hypothetical protein